MVLLQAQEVFAAAAEQQAIAQHQGAVRQGGQEALPAAVQLEHVHVEAALQAAAVQRLADQLRIGRDFHFRQVATAGEAGDQVVVVGAAVGQKAIGQQHHHRTAHQPHADADRREAEQAEGAIAELAAHLAGQQVD